MIVVMIVPTGIGAEIGGHAGDATPAARMLAACCDTLITHPNVLNASDINEIPENCLYVEGSMLNRFLRGVEKLRLVGQNKILLAVNSPVREDTVNSVSAARLTLGADIEIVELSHPLVMRAEFMEGGAAGGSIEGQRELIEQVRALDFQALAVQSEIEVDTRVALKYLKHGGVNPWGGVEARLSRVVSEALDKPVAHAPLESDVLKYLKIVADPRMAAEFVSMSYLHCVLKGLHRAPLLATRSSARGDLHVWDVDALVSPHGCVGPPHLACLEHEIPVIVVRENRTIFNEELDAFVYVENYHEAAGHLMCMRAGVLPASVRRPVEPTRVSIQGVNSA
jgi:hypothetical protein